MDNRYPSTWCIPSSHAYSIAENICNAIVSVYPMHVGWKNDILKTVDGFLEESSIDVTEFVAKEIEKCLKTCANSQK